MAEEEKNKEVQENAIQEPETKEEPKKPEENKGGLPEWAQKLQKQVNELAAKVESKPQEKKKEVVMIPEPLPPKQEEPTQAEPKQNEPEQTQPPKSKARTLWDWLK